MKHQVEEEISSLSDGALHIGFVLDGNLIPRWISHIISHFATKEGIKITLFLPEKSRSFAKYPSEFRGLARILYQWHERLDRLCYGTKEMMLDEIEIDSMHIQSMIYCTLSKEVKLDVLINCSSEKVPDELCSFPKYGIWWIDQNFESIDRCQAGYWQTTQQHPETTTALWHLDYDDKKKLLYISSQITDYHSIHKNRNKFYKRSILIINRVLEKLSVLGNGYYEKLIEEHEGQQHSFFRPVPRTHTGTDVVKNVITHVRTLLMNVYMNALFLDHWFLMFSLEKSQKNGSTDFPTFTPLYSPKDRFWADPFVISRKGFHYLFVEEWIYAQAKGRIAVITLDYDGKYIESKPILETPYHLSYPYIFRHEGVDFMIPETCDNGTIDLYKCVSFPDQWKYEKTLVSDIHAVDVTPFYADNKWWIFCNVDEGDGKSSINDELFLFYTDDLFNGKWQSHPRNPIISDVKRARPAGKIMSFEDQLIRPSQNASKCYGNALNMNKILKISETEYEEELIEEFRPYWNSWLKRLHTYNYEDGITVIDSFYYRKKWQ